MSNVLVDKSKLDILANAISDKSGEPVTMTLEEMVEAVDGIETGGGGITPTGNINITSAGVTDVTEYATATVPEGEMFASATSHFETVSGARKWTLLPYAAVVIGDNYGHPGYIEDGTIKYSEGWTYNAIAKNTSVTPTESAQTIGGANTMMEGAVAVNAIPSNYVGSGITQRSSSDLTASGATVTAPAGYYSSAATKSVASGTEGTPTASKGSVSNHAVTVTPSVTNSAGYISGGTKTGTAVSVSASELVSGNLPITQNGTGIDVTNYATVSVSVSGGGGSGVSVDTVLNSAATTSTLTFTNLSGEPTSFAVMIDNEVSTSSTAKICAIVYDGTDVHTQTITNTSNAQVSYVSSGVSYSYSNGTLVITSASAQFVTNGGYYMAYSYGGTSGNIGTSDVQVGSGATSITFTGLEDEPLCWSCIFKSNFSTSSGYQRVIFVRNDGEIIEGMEMDSSAKNALHWTASYSNGSLTITSNGTNQGGYFHQPGYYQLTYVIGEASPYQKINKTYYASTSAQSEKIEPSTGYDAIGEVNVSIPAVSQTNLIASNIKDGTTVTISNGSTNLWSVTGSYTGSGGGGVNIATATATNSNNQNTSVSFTLPSGRTPKAFFCRLTSQIARNSNSRYYYVFDMLWDGSSTGGVAGNTFYMYSGTLTDVTSGYSYSQSGTTFELSSTGTRSASPGSFYNGTYELTYVY